MVFRSVVAGLDLSPRTQRVAAYAATVARHPQFSQDAYMRHRATADVALVQLAAPLAGAQPAALDASGYKGAVGDRLTVAGYGLTVRGDGATGGTARMASLIVTGQPGTLQIRLYDAQTRNERAGCWRRFGSRWW